MAILVNPYTTVQLVKRECQDKESDTTDDDWFEQIITRASRKVEEMTHRDFWFHDHSSSALEIISSWATGNTIYLPWPAITLTTVLMNGVALDADEWHLLTKIVKRGSAQIKRADKLFWSTEGGSITGPTHPDPIDTVITLVGTFGYTIINTETPPSDLPEGVQRGATLIAAAWSGKNRKQYTPMDGEPIEFTEYRIPKEARDLLKDFTWKVF